MPDIHFASPGDPDTLTGGYLYNRRVCEALRSDGWTVHAVRLADAFPFPQDVDLEEAARLLSVIPAEDVVIVDGLAFGAFPEAVVSAIRGRIVALVHHPLAEETGLDAAWVAGLFESERLALRLAAGVLVSSPHTRRSLIERYDVPGEKIVAAIPGVDRPVVRPAGGVATRPPCILSVGSLTVRKGHDTLLDALALIRDLEWCGVIVGATDRDPVVAERLMRQCAALDLDGRVDFAGERSVDDIKQDYVRASVFALATRHEGYGIVFSEAMVNGLPIVSCRAGAVPETVPANAGLLVPPDKPDAFADALRQILTNAGLRSKFGAASLAAGDELPTWEDTARIIAGKAQEVISA